MRASTGVTARDHGCCRTAGRRASESPFTHWPSVMRANVSYRSRRTTPINEALRNGSVIRGRCISSLLPTFTKTFPPVNTRSLLSQRSVLALGLKRDT